MSKDKSVADAIDRNFTSPNVSDAKLEPANIVDVIQRLALSIEELAQAIELLARAKVADTRKDGD